jgi:predicted DsbA family dithiol-disulfide isomerase
MARSIAVTFDYRCPFAYNGHSSVIAALRAGADLDVRYVPFSLDQVHVAEDEKPVWERPPAERGSGVLALEWGIAVRDAFPERFLDAHVAIFAARHDHGEKLADENVLRKAVTAVDLDADAVAEEVASGRPLETLAREHADAAKRWGMFGVPTFCVDDRAVFVRLMERDVPDDVDGVLDIFAFERLNEFKYTRIPR